MVWYPSLWISPCFTGSPDRGAVLNEIKWQRSIFMCFMTTVKSLMKSLSISSISLARCICVIEIHIELWSHFVFWCCGAAVIQSPAIHSLHLTSTCLSYKPCHTLWAVIQPVHSFPSRVDYWYCGVCYDHPGNTFIWSSVAVQME